MENTVETNVVENKENIQENPPIQEAPKPETQEQINWKRFREAREVERKQKEAAEKDAARKAEEIAALKAAMESLVNKPARASDSYDATEETEDQRIQKKVDAALAERERQYEQQRLQKEQQEFPQRLVSTFSDFNQVCTSDNLDYLEYHYPEVAAPYKHLPDSYDKWAAIYKAVKRFVPNPDSGKDQRKAEKNFNKPQSMAVAGNTQTTDSAPIMLDEKRRQDNWARMQRIMKGGK